MAIIWADRVADTSITTGTGPVSVSGTPPTGFRTFADVCATSDTIYYCIAHQSANEWEVGLGTYSSANTLTRTTVLQSSNANAAVNFSSGTKDVFAVHPASLMSFTQTGTGATQRQIQSKLREVEFSAKDFGAACDGSTDDRAAIILALAALDAAGGGTLVIPGVSVISDTLSLGDGSNSAHSTTHNRIRIIGRGRGSSDEVSNTQIAPVSGLKYTGTTSTSKAVLSLVGPIHTISLEDLQLDCNDKAGIGLEVIHVTDTYFKNVNVVNYTTLAYSYTTRTGFPSGCAYGCGNGVQINCNAYGPANNTAVAIKLTSGVSGASSLASNPDTANMDFIGGVYIYGGSTNSYGVHLHGADNNTFYGSQFIPAGGNNGGGKSVFFEQWTGSTAFPQENAFYQLGISQDVGGTSGTGGNFFGSLATSDGAAVPTLANVHSIAGSLGKTYMADGTAALPSYSFGPDHTTGIYRDTGTLGLTVSGSARTLLTTSVFAPATSDGLALGSTTQMWSDYFAASGHVFNWNNGDVTLTHSSNALAFAGASSGYSFDALLDLSGAAAGQIKFPAAQNASSNANTLDDYEEGTWTPVLTFDTPGNLSVTYSAQNGAYTKIGQLVCYAVDITTSAFTHTTAAGGMRITGIPFTATNSFNYRGGSLWQGITKANYTDLVLVTGSGTSTWLFGTLSGSGQTASSVLFSDMPTGGTVRFSGTGFYTAA
jgi:hypothetical protein